MGIDNNLVIPVLVSLINLIVSNVRVTTISKQQIKDIKIMLINYMLYAQMFVHVRGIFPLCCDQFWDHYSKKVIIAHIAKNAFL